MKPTLAPIHIHWCIMFWTRGDPVTDLGEEHFNSPAGGDTLRWMLDEKLIEWSHNEGRHVPTERLGVFINHLCAQPLPVQKWIMPDQSQ
jgi:hypothetical protein